MIDTYLSDFCKELATLINAVSSYEEPIQHWQLFHGNANHIVLNAPIINDVIVCKDDRKVYLNNAALSFCKLIKKNKDDVFIKKEIDSSQSVKEFEMQVGNVVMYFGKEYNLKLERFEAFFQVFVDIRYR